MHARHGVPVHHIRLTLRGQGPERYRSVGQNLVQKGRAKAFQARIIQMATQRIHALRLVFRDAPDLLLL